jgi:hypothetical protein
MVSETSSRRCPVCDAPFETTLRQRIVARARRS